MYNNMNVCTMSVCMCVTLYPRDLTLITVRKRSNVEGKNCRAWACCVGDMNTGQELDLVWPQRTHSSWSDELVLWTLESHHGARGSEEILQTLQELLTVLASCTPGGRLQWLPHCRTCVHYIVLSVLMTAFLFRSCAGMGYLLFIEDS